MGFFRLGLTIMAAVASCACGSSPPPEPQAEPDPHPIRATLTCDGLRQGGLVQLAARASQSADTQRLTDNVLDAYAIGEVIGTSNGARFRLQLIPEQVEAQPPGELSIAVGDDLDFVAEASLPVSVVAELKAKLTKKGTLTVLGWQRTALKDDVGRWLGELRSGQTPNGAALVANDRVRVVTAVYSAKSLELRGGDDSTIGSAVSVPLAAGEVRVTNGCTTSMKVSGSNVARMESVYVYDAATKAYVAANDKASGG